MLTESGILDSLSDTGSGFSSVPNIGNLEKLNDINALFGDVQQFCKGNPNASLEDFLGTLAIREEFDLPLETRDIHTFSDTLQLLTAHKAKGLEFEAVFIVHCVSGKWGDSRKRPLITLPDGIFQFAPTDHDENEDERRLFFVACTRAKHHLFFTYSENDGQGRSKTGSRFLSEIPPQTFTLEASDTNDKNTAFEIVKSQLLWKEGGKLKFPMEFLRRAVDPQNFVLSHSAFESFRENPQKFLWEYILRIPSVKHPSAVLGTALHRALEEFTHLLPRENIAVAQKALRESLQREILTEQEFSDLEREGLEVLNAYYKEYTGHFIPALQTELNFRSHNVFLDGNIPMTGKIDKVEWIDESAHTVKVVDYKTTAPKSENEIRGIRDSDSGNITAGRYFRQLVFYSLLCDLSPKFQKNAEIFAIDFLVPNQSGAFKKLEFHITNEEKQALKEEIRLVWTKIQNLDFAPVNLWGDAVQEEIFGFLE
jgi:DNA helicase-2/ATP-dependent DNA helicase PcrA